MLHRRIALLAVVPLAYFVINAMLVDDGVLTTLLAPKSAVHASLALALVALRLATIFVVPALFVAAIVSWRPSTT